MKRSAPLFAAATPDASRPTITAPLWEPEPAPGAMTTSAVMDRSGPPESLPPDLETTIVAAMTRPAMVGESHYEAAARREREVGTILATVTPVQAFHLGRRLDAARPDDRVVAAFARLVVERRVRLRAFLADAPRRAARS